MLYFIVGTWIGFLMGFLLFALLQDLKDWAGVHPIY